MTGITGYIIIAIIVWIVLFIDTRKTKIYDLLEKRWLGLSPLELLTITMIAVYWVVVAFVLAIGIIILATRIIYLKLSNALFPKKPTRCLPHEGTGDS